MSSTLKPGKTSDKVRHLRDAAIKEMEAPEEGTFALEKLKFDHGHEVVRRAFDYDNPKDTPVYQGQNSPHIGNGKGGVQ